jgi:16S rRNA (guanine527-N7)-methyltransferase
VPDPTALDPRWLRLREDAAEFGVQLSPEQLSALATYRDLLCEWNQRFNLTAIADPEEVLTKHFLDSLSVARVLNLGRRKTLIDVGTGAGFPGLVLKIAYPHLRVTLLDSLEKRLRFLDRVAEELGLAEVFTVHARAEDAAKPGPGTLRERFDVVTARAVARLRVLAEWTLPFARLGGVMVAMKGPGVGAEVEEAGPALRRLGGRAERVEELVLPRTDVGRSLVLIVKERATPKDLPRQPGSAKKDPL